MELYVLDELLRRVAVIDKFQSLIWKERFAGAGDFELVLPSTTKNRSLLPAGTKLAVNTSKRGMIVETIEKKNDAEGRMMLYIKGPSFERILDDRVAYMGEGGYDLPKWFLSSPPAEVARQIFDAICVTPNQPENVIPFYQPGSLYPASTIAEPTEIIELEIEAKSVYELLVEICGSYGLGFRLVHNVDRSELYFDVYSGRDVSTNQTFFAPVIFSEALDNLEDTTALTSISGKKNACHVYSKMHSVLVYDIGVDPTVAGFERKVTYLKVDEEPGSNVTDIPKWLRQKGMEHLANLRGLSAFEGKIPEVGSYRYGVDYELGDIVEMRSEDGKANFMRVSEQIMISDAEGDRSYPTLTIDYSIEPGTWLAWDYNQTWELATKTWAEA